NDQSVRRCRHLRNYATRRRGYTDAPGQRHHRVYPARPAIVAVHKAIHHDTYHDRCRGQQHTHAPEHRLQHPRMALDGFFVSGHVAKSNRSSIVVSTSMPNNPNSPAETAPEPARVTIADDQSGERLDRVLAAALGTGAGDLSRSRIKALIEAGQARLADGATIDDPAFRVK